MSRHAFVRGFSAALLLVLIMGIPAVPGAYAAAFDEIDPELAQRFEGKNWDDVVSAFFDKWGIYQSSVTIGYYNTVTGEEHYINGDMYLHAASLYKLPLNMYYAEKVYNGEMAMDDLIYGIPYEHIQTNSVQFSSNELSEMLQENIGSYRDFKDAIAQYLCDNPDELPYQYYTGNFFTAEQFIYALKKLYEAPERYPNVLELMKNAAPNNYFALQEDRFVIAQKYGYFMDEGLGSLNDAAIIYTDEPILLVLMSDFMAGGIFSMAEFCTLMCDYTQYSHQKRAQAEFLAAQQTPEPSTEPSPEPAAAPRPLKTMETQPQRTAATQPQQTAPPSGEQWNTGAVAVMGILFSLALVLSLLFLKKALRYLIPASAALLFAAGLFLFGKTAPKNDVLPEAAPTPIQTATAAPVHTSTPEPQPTPTPAPIDRIVDLGGIPVPGGAESAVLRGANISAAELSEALQYLPALKTADICDLGFTNEESLEIIERYPEIDFTWTVNFGRWAVRSDICVFSTLQSGEPGYRYTNEDLAPLFTYCTELAALDLGHNAVTDLAPIAKLDKLQVLIIPDNKGLVDISPLGDMRQLRYLELFLNSGIEDFSALGKLTNMVDINLSYSPHLKDADFLSNMPALRMGWFKASGIPSDRWAAIQAAHPEAKLLFYYPGSVSSTCDDWRATDRNVAIRKAFANWADVLAFAGWDEVEYREGAALVETYPVYEYE